MKFLSITPANNKHHHDSSISYFDGEELHYLKSERIEQIKHHYIKTKKDYENYLKKFYSIELKNIDEISLCSFYKNGIGLLPEDFFNMKYNSSVYQIDHHLAHSLSVEMFSDEKPDVSIVIDGQGGDNSWVVYKNDNLIDAGKVGVCGSFGYGMALLGKILNVSGHPLDWAGKVMGLQSYGVIDYSFLKELQIYDEYNIGAKLIGVVSTNPHPKLEGSKLFSLYKYMEYRKKELSDDDILNWATTVHYRCGEIILNLFKKYAKPDDIIHYSGGVAQNIIWNTLLKKHFKNLVILPHSGDEGVSLGGIEYLRQKHNLPKIKLKNFPFSQTDECPETEIQEDTIQKVAELLSLGKIVAWYQGHGEIGPRALGNRSILMDPRIKNGRDIINKIKNREYYRPFGASILSEFKKEYFDLDFENPYMLYVGVTQKNNLESITHVDGTCRVQTVSEDGHFRTLLKKFYDLTGCPVLLNTSLNNSGKPIAGYIQNAIDEFNNTSIDVLVVGNKIYQK
jgi:carbamoyltransferase